MTNLPGNYDVTDARAYAKRFMALTVTPPSTEERRLAARLLAACESIEFERARANQWMHEATHQTRRAELMSDNLADLRGELQEVKPNEADDAPMLYPAEADETLDKGIRMRVSLGEDLLLQVEEYRNDPTLVGATHVRVVAYDGEGSALATLGVTRLTDPDLAALIGACVDTALRMYGGTHVDVGKRAQ